MRHRRVFRAFFSYAHADAEADPKLIEALTTELEQRVNLGLTNDQLKIWRDTKNLRLSDIWEQELDTELRSSDVLIVLLTPRWLGSDICLKEYTTFLEIEDRYSQPGYPVSYVAPILARPLSPSEQENLQEDQREIFTSITKRQYKTVAPDLALWDRPRRLKIVANIADDIHGIIDRLRKASASATSPLPVRASHRRSKAEFPSSPCNYDDVDFLSNAEVFLNLTNPVAHTVQAQIDFVERLYVQRRNGARRLRCAARLSPN